MTSPAPVTSDDLAALHAAATEAGLTVTSSASWPETEADREVTPRAGFIESNFSPLIAEVAERALHRRALSRQALSRRDKAQADDAITAIVMVTNLGDVTSATRVAAAVDGGRRVSPLLFFQSVPNSIAGYLAARWRLTGPVVCVSGTKAGLEAAALLIDDGDTDEALIVRVEVAVTDGGGRDHAAAVLVTGPTNQEGP